MQKALILPPNPIAGSEGQPQPLIDRGPGAFAKVGKARPGGLELGADQHTLPTWQGEDTAR
ncbi:hypothetical protein VD0002_g7315 [Verticillium dahliae]|uniref:Uncharacterized protein n=1 Tax=Verticillium dahliae TaxID=27337 RepID=A0A2J8D9V5_VERDA|nr:hypothetical protein BJF96_g6714 [Verticillium dahliae]PNH46050.1 hypothetical protein VD0004_g1974 [Verticillium dahliae]PNH48877.1 hypothetical protein VD0003_g8247 [Verticillium dahliae]PNH60309.1 hypothetical protein VD0002_g7315 [Verticillium dahliae]PNH65461.1 hypothetical protein VD0001_g8490 [Verticillium dahliae]